MIPFEGAALMAFNIVPQNPPPTLVVGLLVTFGIRSAAMVHSVSIVCACVAGLVVVVMVNGTGVVVDVSTEKTIPHMPTKRKREHTHNSIATSNRLEKLQQFPQKSHTPVPKAERIWHQNDEKNI